MGTPAMLLPGNYSVLPDVLKPDEQKMYSGDFPNRIFELDIQTDVRELGIALSNYLFLQSSSIDLTLLQSYSSEPLHEQCIRLAKQIIIDIKRKGIRRVFIQTPNKERGVWVNGNYSKAYIDRFGEGGSNSTQLATAKQSVILEIEVIDHNYATNSNCTDSFITFSINSISILARLIYPSQRVESAREKKFQVPTINLETLTGSQIMEIMKNHFEQFGVLVDINKKNEIKMAYFAQLAGSFYATWGLPPYNEGGVRASVLESEEQDPFNASPEDKCVRPKNPEIDESEYMKKILKKIGMSLQDSFPENFTRLWTAENVGRYIKEQSVKFAKYYPICLFDDQDNLLAWFFIGICKDAALLESIFGNQVEEALYIDTAGTSIELRIAAVKNDDGGNAGELKETLENRLLYCEIELLNMLNMPAFTRVHKDAQQVIRVANLLGFRDSGKCSTVDPERIYLIRNV